MLDEAKVMRQIERDQIRLAQREVNKAKRRVEMAEAKMQIALDERNAADDALSEANYRLHCVTISQRAKV